MNWIDFSVFIILLLAFLNGYRRGLFKEMTTFIGLLLGVIAAVTHADWLASIMRGKIGISQSVLYVICFILIFAACLAVLKIFGHYFYVMVKLQSLKPSDKIGGGIFGVFKGLIVLSLLFILFIFPTPFRNLNNAIDAAVFAGPIRGIVPLAYDNSRYLHPRSSTFLAKVENGINFSNGEEYASRSQTDDEYQVPPPEMTEDDRATLEKLNEVFDRSRKY